MRLHGMCALALGALLAGCASEPVAQQQPFSVPAPPTSTAPVVLSPEEEQLFGPRVELPGGLLLKQFGKVAQWGGPDDTDPKTWGIRVVLDKVEIDPKCDPYTPKVDRAHRLVLSMRVETSASYDPTADSGPFYYRWSTTGPDGLTEAAPSSSYGCRSANDLAMELRPSAKYRGEVVVESANASGQLVLDNFFAWNYPA